MVTEYVGDVVRRLLSNLYTDGNAAGAAVLEDLLVYRRHREMTVRVGVTDDGALNLFSVDRDLAVVYSKMLSSVNSIHFLHLPSVDPEQFAALLKTDEFRTIVNELSGYGDVESSNYTERWSDQSAAAYLERIASSESKGAQLRERLSYAARSEGSARTVLYDVFGWKVERLDAIIRDLCGPISTLVQLYDVLQRAPHGSDVPLARTLVETVAAIREHGVATARIGANKDGSINVFSRSEAFGRALVEAIRSARGDHEYPSTVYDPAPRCRVKNIGNVMLVDPEQFAKVAWEPSTSNVLNQRRPSTGGLEGQP